MIGENSDSHSRISDANGPKRTQIYLQAPERARHILRVAGRSSSRCLTCWIA